MTYDFDTPLDRRGTHSVKWDSLRENFGRDDLLPLWVADMDFATPPFVVDCLRRRLEHPVLGYTFAGDDWSSAIVDWLANRYQWLVSPDSLTYLPGIVHGLAYVVQAFTQPGDKVLVMSPVYHPFFLVSSKLGREVVYSPLSLAAIPEGTASVSADRVISIDFDRLEADLKGCRAMVLCHPHNPGGRAWTLEELQTIARLCRKEGVLVISDEIHADLTLSGHRHRPFATVCPEATGNCVTMMAPSKAFNMAGLSSSYAVVPDAGLQARFRSFIDAGEFDFGHLFSYEPLVAAYRQGGEWLGQMLAYVEANLDWLETCLQEHLPQVSMIRPQASFLVYLDFRRTGLSQEALVHKVINEAHLALNDGAMFGPEGRGFMRLNVGCPRATLQQAMDQLCRAFA